ncbi:MAG: hypothetical protein BroJett018_16290 [Chloroflexota bacterium]|nr:MAG: hypothetical protein BroJett018_16290 [Chloroflexota bacterium]
MVLKEERRLYPPAWSMSRQAVETVDIGGYRIAKGSEVNIIPYATHMMHAGGADQNASVPQIGLSPV